MADIFSLVMLECECNSDHLIDWCPVHGVVIRPHYVYSETMGEFSLYEGKMVSRWDSDHPLIYTCRLDGLGNFWHCSTYEPIPTRDEKHLKRQ